MKMKKKLLATLAASGQMFAASFAFAQNPIETPPPIPPVGGSTIQDLVALLARLAGYLMYVAGAIAVVFLIIGGIYYITSSGDTQKADKARKILINSITGIVIIALSLLIVNLLADFFSR